MITRLLDGIHLTELYQAKPLAWPALYVALMFAAPGSYLTVQEASFWLSCLALVLFSRYPYAQAGNLRFFWLSVVCAVLYVLLPVQTLFFFGLFCALLYALESFTGKLPAGIFPVMLLVSPVAGYAAAIFSFPVRLQFSRLAAALLQYTGARAQAIGNTIVYNGISFDVDQASVGISMLVSALLIAIIGKLLFEARYHRRLPASSFFIIGLFFILSNGTANLLRIVLLVYFHLEPGSFMHHFTGLCCWIFCGILPGMWLVRKMVLHMGTYEPVPALKYFRQPPVRSFQLKHLCLLATFTLLLQLKPMATNSPHAMPAAAIPGYTMAALPQGVVQYKSNDVLIYIKSIRGFYSTNHNPSIFWKNSGFGFSRVQPVKRGAMHLYTATLTKKQTTLYSAWWYEHAGHRTAFQLSWRLHSLWHQHPYKLVHIAAATPQALDAAVDAWVKEKHGSIAAQ